MRKKSKMTKKRFPRWKVKARLAGVPKKMSLRVANLSPKRNL